MTLTSHPALAAAQQQGAGNLLRIVLVVLLIGAALMAWFLLRGYRGAGLEEGGPDDGDQGGGSRPARGGGSGPAGADRRPRVTDGEATAEDLASGRRGPGRTAREGRRGTMDDHLGAEGSGENHPGDVTAVVSQGDDPASDSA